jgi:erythronate-4-phosphate dehydrogenase
MLRVIADDKIPFLKGILEPFASIKYLPAALITEEVLKNFDVLLIRTLTKCNSSLLEGSEIKFIATATIGYDHIDTEYCKSKNIHWVNAPGCNSSAVQQYWLAAILTLAENHQFQLSDKTLGIIGVGNVGSKVELAARLLGMKVKLNDPPRARNEGPSGFVGLDEILETSDIISLHVPLNRDREDKTFHLFDNSIFGKMKPGAILINTSRGEVVDTSALNKALLIGTVNAAMLDVWENEPNVDRKLLNKAFIATPHIAGYSHEGKANATAMIVESFSEYFDLPIHDFSIPSLPAPNDSEILIDANSCSFQEIIRRAVLHTYPIMHDHEILQKLPDSFKQQRSNYHFRREFPAYIIRLKNSSAETVNTLVKLGFIVSRIK